MALVKQTLEAQLTTLFDSLASDAGDPAAARQRLVQELATAVDAYIKTATVNVTVVTAGTATNHTGTGTGTLS
jgi:hypothetical protein